MKAKLFIVVSACLFCFGQANAQWVVTDPTNLAQGILNSGNQIVEASQTVNNTMENFKETKKVFEQGKQFYDALKAVKKLIKDARKVQKIVLMVGEVSEIYVTNYERMLSDDNYSLEELEAIASGYAILLAESVDLLKEVKSIITENSFSMNDSERMAIIDRVFHDVKKYRDLVWYFTRKNISISLIRAERKGTLDRVFGLYGNNNEKYW